MKRIRKKPTKRGVGRPLATIDERTLAGQLGARIRAARLAKRWTLADLAAALDQPEATLRNWESGRRCLPIGQAVAVCAALGLRIEDLVATGCEPLAMDEPPKALPGPEKRRTRP